MYEKMSNLKDKIIKNVDVSVSHNLKITFTDDTEVIIITENPDASVIWVGPNQ